MRIHTHIAVFILGLAMLVGPMALYAQSADAPKPISPQDQKQMLAAKEAWIKEHPEEYAKANTKQVAPASNGLNKSSENLPQGFPKPISSGNKEADEKANDAAKARWIQNNPEKYKQLTQSGSSNSSPGEIAPTKAAVQYSDIPSFIDTGHPEQDLVKYIAEKKAYALRHPDSIK